MGINGGFFWHYAGYVLVSILIGRRDFSRLDNKLIECLQQGKKSFDDPDLVVSTFLINFV